MTAPERGTFAGVLAELAAEHRVAVDRHGFTEEHDDRHDDGDWGWRLLRRVSELLTPPTVLPSTPEERRRAFLEVAHIAASAVAAHDRRAAARPGAPAVVEVGGAAVDAVAGRVEFDPPVVLTSTDTCHRYVTRPGGDGIERHRLDCDRWRPVVVDGEAVACVGCGEVEEVEADA